MKFMAWFISLTALIKYLCSDLLPSFSSHKLVSHVTNKMAASIPKLSVHSEFTLNRPPSQDTSASQISKTDEFNRLKGKRGQTIH